MCRLYFQIYKIGVAQGPKLFVGEGKRSGHTGLIISGSLASHINQPIHTIQ